MLVIICSYLLSNILIQMQDVMFHFLWPVTLNKGQRHLVLNSRVNIPIMSSGRPLRAPKHAESFSDYYDLCNEIVSFNFIGYF